MTGPTIGGKYVLERELAHGGMGAVWIALDPQLQRQVAIKLLGTKRAASETLHRRFEREAVAIARLNSPHVVQIYDYGVDAGTPYFVMELLEGEDLQAKLDRVGKLPFASVARVVTQTAKALSIAHANGIIHRDIKPANIFLARTHDSEVVKVLDFGVASMAQAVVSGDFSVTSGEGLVGTPQYMSPEQMRCLPTLDMRSDLWSLGVVAYRALTGRLPFDAESLGDLLIAICTDPVPLPSQVAPDLGVHFDTFFARALARDPVRRFDSAADMALAFAELDPESHGKQPAKILVVDDEPYVEVLMKQRFRKEIRRGSYVFTFAADGTAALEALLADPTIEIALTDLNMPKMDGLTFLARVAEHWPSLKVVVVSAYSDMANLRQAMNRGAFDFLVKPIDFADLERTIDKCLRYVRELRDKTRSAEESDILRMFTPDSVRHRLLPAMRTLETSMNEWVEATVVSVEVHAFSPNATEGSADGALRTLNANFEIVMSELTSHGGIVDKFLGRALVAIFRGDNHLERAARASVAARDEVRALGLRTGPSSPYAHGLSVGLDSGLMLSGIVGSKTLSRLDYIVLGDVVSHAEYLASKASPNQVVVSSEAFQKLSRNFEGQRRTLSETEDPAYELLSQIEPERTSSDATLTSPSPFAQGSRNIAAEALETTVVTARRRS